VTMESPMMSAYARLLIHTCHKRGVHAMGGMSAYIPRKDDEGLNRIALSQVSQDKAREAMMGHDGTWVAHPGLVELARNEFKVFNQDSISKTMYDDRLEDLIGYELLYVPEGDITYSELCNNVRVCLQYMAAWMQGRGCVPLNYMMEDMATAEISRVQIWQWCYWGVEIDDERLDWTTMCVVIDQEAQKLIDEQYAPVHIIEYVTDKFTEMTNSRPSEFPQFIADVLYEDLDAPNKTVNNNNPR
jgi:malate synthase